jgi:hypothetical protein
MISRYVSSSISIIIIGFIVVLIIITDGSAGFTWASKFGLFSIKDIQLYSIVIGTAIGIQIFLLFIMTRIVFKIQKSSSRLARPISYIFVISQIILIFLLAYLLVEQLATSVYQIILPKLIVGLSMTISVLIMISLAYTCFRSYSSSRSKMTLIYASAVTLLSLYQVFAFIYVESTLNDKPDYITPDRNPWTSYFTKPILEKLLSIYNITKILSFVSIWIASILLTISYGRRVRKVRYWTIVSIPMIFLLVQYFLVVLNQMGALAPLMLTEGSIFPYVQNFASNTVSVTSGIFIGFSFFLLSKSLIYANLKYYVIMCGTGLMMIFSISISQILVLSPFPAWGVISISFSLPAAFLTLIGLSSATFRIASDITLRRSLGKFRTEFELLSSLGSAERSLAIEKRVRGVTSKIYKEIESEGAYIVTPESEEIEKHVRELIAEMKKARTKFDDTKSGNSFN